MKQRLRRLILGALSLFRRPRSSGRQLPVQEPCFEPKPNVPATAALLDARALLASSAVLEASRRREVEEVLPILRCGAGHNARWGIQLEGDARVGPALPRPVLLYLDPEGDNGAGA